MIRSPCEIQRREPPAEKSDHHEKTERQRENEALGEGRSVKEDQFEIEHRPKDEECKLRSHRKGGKRRCDEGICCAADREDGGQSHKGDDGQRGISR